MKSTEVLLVDLRKRYQWAFFVDLQTLTLATARIARALEPFAGVEILARDLPIIEVSMRTVVRGYVVTSRLPAICLDELTTALEQCIMVSGKTVAQWRTFIAEEAEAYEHANGEACPA